MDRNINFSLSVYFFFPLKWLVFQENLSAHSELSASSDSLSKNKVRSSSCCSGSRDNVTWNFNVHTEICDKWARAYCSCLSQGKKTTIRWDVKEVAETSQSWKWSVRKSDKTFPDSHDVFHNYSNKNFCFRTSSPCMVTYPTPMMIWL